MINWLQIPPNSLDIACVSCIGQFCFKQNQWGSKNSSRKQLLYFQERFQPSLAEIRTMNLANTRLRLILLPLIHVVNGELIKHISWHASTSAFILSLVGKDFRSSLLMVCLVNRTLWSEYSNCKVKISKWIFQHQCRASANQKNITQL